MSVSSQIRLRKSAVTRGSDATRLTMLRAKVVLPEMAMLIPATQAQERALPESLVLAWRTGPPPPAVLTDQPRRAKAAIMAAIDLMKKSHRIFRGWIMTSGNWTAGRQLDSGMPD